jgi:hypothetical protein
MCWNRFEEVVAEMAGEESPAAERERLAGEQMLETANMNLTYFQVDRDGNLTPLPHSTPTEYIRIDFDLSSSAGNTITIPQGDILVSTTGTNEDIPF